ncbi:uncharacterized protein ACA1_164530 [Acanthamoeba castellanii str. Neff]|uniref:Uncharacterized protein n=1 Tax=Acanthamoeba castellanii (strain ATCC 30010 / Neff) TaxID=1257118 RepID=L8GSN3_ACACF|nr:uncharacterized protein ACA1_164530 [Acanthamoeba castellanii str. Neff]ELR15583.1 hypothetical protein ACA1_164530 [Acanthamoeba castellanii str. Neff]
MTLRKEATLRDKVARAATANIVLEGRSSI